MRMGPKIEANVGYKFYHVVKSTSLQGLLIYGEIETFGMILDKELNYLSEFSQFFAIIFCNNL